MRPTTTSRIGCSVLVLMLWIGVTLAHAETVKRTGWFACEKCTASRVARGDLRPSNPECARRCIEKGDSPVFISEQGAEVLKIRDYTSATEHLGFHLEVTGNIDAVSKTISIESVTRLEKEGAACARPTKKPKK
jgi:hypothetical protein